MNVRQQVMARQDAEIEASTARAVAARQAESSRKMTAMEAMSARLGVTENELTDALRATVFAGCRSRAEFLALVVVANEYRLNPLTKEIYAFPAKGGGVVPMVSVDGWITLMNSHPDFDGIEFNYHEDDKGNLLAVESIIYHKARSKPIKTIEFMSECKRNTDPWNKSPRRMLRHRALMQGARIAFGFSGIYSQGDEDNGLIEAEYTVVPGGPVVLPGNDAFASAASQPQDGGEPYDPATGEVQRDPRTGMTEIDEDTARALDEHGEAEMYGEAEANVQAMDGPLPEHVDQPGWLAEVRTLRVAISNAKTLKALDAVEREWINRILNMVTEESVARSVEADIRAKRNELKGVQG